MHFEWDPTKARRNLREHSVSFEDATTVFYDPLAATGVDPDHSQEEERWITFGLCSTGELLVVAYTERGEAIRIISARRATRNERRIYEEG